MKTEDKVAPSRAIEDLTLALMYLLRKPTEYENIFFTWKNYDFDTIDKLDSDGYIGQSRKTATFTEEGLEKAREILDQYGIEDWPVRNGKK